MQHHETGKPVAQAMAAKMRLTARANVAAAAAAAAAAVAVAAQAVIVAGALASATANMSSKAYLQCNSATLEKGGADAARRRKEGARREIRNQLTVAPLHHLCTE